MPAMQAMTERLDRLFNRYNIGEINPELLLPGVDLVESAHAAEIALTDPEIAYLKSWPAGLLEAVRAALLSAVNRGLPVNFAWAPGYHYEVSFWEAAGTPQSLGGMTVFFKSPFPADVGLG